ncbi:MAG: hypothetical protein HQ525_00740 [Anaerolineae bacterium]|nr:hypothetical protein [Anaerolineae bacterium]
MRISMRSFALIFVFLTILSSACASNSRSVIPTSTPLPTKTQAPLTARLRIYNSGKMDVENLIVLFPEDGIKFGDISAGSTTEYLDFPNGVFGYAAYQFEIDGQMITQPVTDWVGEVPLDGNTFTYTIDFSSNRPQWEMIKFIEVTIDE